MTEQQDTVWCRSARAGKTQATREAAKKTPAVKMTADERKQFLNAHTGQWSDRETQ